MHSFDEDRRFIESISDHPENIKIIDIGCGPNKFPGATGIDKIERPGIVDIVHDLDIYPWPIEDNCFDIVLCSHLIEHIDDFLATIKEIHRILKPNRYLITRTPHYSNVDSYTDPTHKRHLTSKSLDYFLGNTDKTNLYTLGLFKKDRIDLTFGAGLHSQIGRLLYKLSPHKYEKYWCRIFPATNIYFRLKAIK